MRKDVLSRPMRSTMKKPLIWTLVVSVAVPLFSWLLLANAQDASNIKPDENAAKKGETSLPRAYRIFATRPEPYATAEVRFKLPSGQERVLYIVPQNKGSDLFVKGLYFYTPVLCLAE